MKYGTKLKLVSRKDYSKHIGLGEEFEVIDPENIPEHILSTLCPLLKDEFYIKRILTGCYFLYHTELHKKNFKKIKKG